MNALIQPNNQAFKKTEIKSDLLYELMTRGRGLRGGYGFTGWPDINNTSQVTYGIMTWLAMRSLGLERFPWFPDARFTKELQGTDLQVFKILIDDWRVNPGKLNEASDDLFRIYEHTQAEFARLKITSIPLSRTFSDGWHGDESLYHAGYASRLVTMRNAAIQTGRSSFDIPFRLLSSWGAGGYGNGTVDVSMNIPVKDIAWGNSTVADRTGSSLDAIESGEWIAINRSMNGIVSLPVTAITRDKIDPETIRAFDTISEAESYLDSEGVKLDLDKSVHLPGNYTRDSKMSLSFRVHRALKVLIHGK